MSQSKQRSLDELLPLIGGRRQHGEKIVFTNGCFDLLHVGHVRMLKEAAALGEVLIVAVNSDSSVRRLKGPTRPVVWEADRAAMLAALACVDYVVLFDDATPHRLLEAIRPDVLVKGGAYRIDGVVGREIVEAYGGRVCVTGQVDGVSTTAIVKTLCGHDGEPSVGNALCGVPCSVGTAHQSAIATGLASSPEPREDPTKGRCATNQSGDESPALQDSPMTTQPVSAVQPRVQNNGAAVRRLVLRSFQSPGDVLMLTAAVRDLHLAHPGKFQTDVRTSCDALWEHNPPRVARPSAPPSGQDIRSALLQRFLPD